MLLTAERRARDRWARCVSSAARWPRFAVDTVHRDVSLLVIVLPGRPHRHQRARQLRPDLAHRRGDPVHLELPAAVARARARCRSICCSRWRSPAWSAAGSATRAGARPLARLRELAGRGAARARHRQRHQGVVDAAADRGLRGAPSRRPSASASRGPTVTPVAARRRRSRSAWPRRSAMAVFTLLGPLRVAAGRAAPGPRPACWRKPRRRRWRGRAPAPRSSPRRGPPSAFTASARRLGHPEPRSPGGSLVDMTLRLSGGAQRPAPGPPRRGADRRRRPVDDRQPGRPDRRGLAAGAGRARSARCRARASSPACSAAPAAALHPPRPPRTSTRPRAGHRPRAGSPRGVVMIEQCRRTGRPPDRRGSRGCSAGLGPAGATMTLAEHQRRPRPAAPRLGRRADRRWSSAAVCAAAAAPTSRPRSSCARSAERRGATTRRRQRQRDRAGQRQGPPAARPPAAPGARRRRAGRPGGRRQRGDRQDRRRHPVGRCGRSRARSPCGPRTAIELRDRRRPRGLRDRRGDGGPPLPRRAGWPSRRSSRRARTSAACAAARR